MIWQPVFCVFVLLLVFNGLIKNKAPDALMMGAVILVTVARIISPAEAMSGFSNTGMLTVAALYVVAAALRETGALYIIGQCVLGKVHTERGALLRLAGWVTGMSALLNNTPIAAMFIPIVSDWCRRHRISPSKLLLPMSYLCILGGTCTLIGTSTNLVINGLMEEAVNESSALTENLFPMGFFELGYVGLPCAIVGILYLLFVGHRWLPERKDLLEDYSTISRSYLVNMRIEPNCPLSGQTVQEADLRHLPGLFLVEIQRDEEVITPVQPDHILMKDDVLVFTGVIGTIVDLEKIVGLVPVADESYILEATQRRRHTLCEAVVSSAFPGVGKSIRDVDFRARYNAAVIAVHRGGERLLGKVGDIKLRPGDTLLLQAGPHFARANRNNAHFLLVGGVDESRPVRHDKAIYALVLLGLLIGLLMSGLVTVVVAAFLVAGLMVIFRCIDMTDARRNVDWQILITIAAALGFSKALDRSGLVSLVAGFLVDTAGSLGPYGVLVAVYLLTILFTETITNNAAAALVFPFAVAVAGQINASPRPFVMAVAFAASASFMTPIGYQTNLMVLGPGGYRYIDFIRIGLPLNLILLICATLLIPMVWTF